MFFFTSGNVGRCSPRYCFHDWIMARRSVWAPYAISLENDLTFLHAGIRMTSLTDANAVGNDAGAKAFTHDSNGNLTHDGRKDLDIQ